MSAQVALRRAHRMPFGAEARDDGTTRFRLWAPAARSVELWLADREQGFAMSRDATGWAEWVTRDAAAGARYSFRIDGDLLVPDPASRFQPDDVHGASEVVGPLDYAWSDGDWRGLPPERLVFYEIHVGTFSPEGTFAGLADRLDHLVSLGVTAVELMPVSDFPGRRGWGYDGILPFAPESSYGRPETLKALVEACHARGLAVFLDVVYNHFGPEGNYLHRYAPAFFSRAHKTPWGDALNFDEPGCEVVRSFVVHNALYWLEEFHLDGLRLDAVHAIADSSAPHVLGELARAGEDKRPLYQAQWNDDLHHAIHTLLTGERDGYYADYQPPLPHLARALGEGFAPLLFMGQEWAAPEPFLFFSELGGDFGAAVSEGRRREFARFPEFAGPRARMRIPDPQDERTFARSVLDWRRTARTPGREWIDFHRTLLDVRSRDIMPLLSGEPVPETRWALLAETALEATWTFPEQRVLRLIANLGAAPVRHGGPQPDWGRAIYALGPGGPAWTELVPWSVYWYVSEASR